MGKKVKEFKAGDFIFAKVKGYPAWPARIQRLNGKKYFIYFYGTGETANLAHNVIFDYAEHKDKFLNKTIKRKDFNDGVKQIEYDFANNISIEEVLGGPVADPADSSTANVTATDTTLDGSSAADTTVIDTINGSGDSFTVTLETGAVDSDDGALVIDEGKKNKKLPGGKAVSTPKPPKTPKTPKTKKDDAATPLAAEEEKEEIVSRSGRKIRPKRYADEQTEENATLPSPIPKKRRTSAEKETTDKAKPAPPQAEKGKNYVAFSVSDLEDIKETSLDESNLKDQNYNVSQTQATTSQKIIPSFGRKRKTSTYDKTKISQPKLKKFVAPVKDVKLDSVKKIDSFDKSLEVSDGNTNVNCIDVQRFDSKENLRQTGLPQEKTITKIHKVPSLPQTDLGHILFGSLNILNEENLTYSQNLSEKSLTNEHLDIANGQSKSDVTELLSVKDLESFSSVVSLNKVYKDLDAKSQDNLANNEINKQEIHKIPCSEEFCKMFQVDNINLKTIPVKFKPMSIVKGDMGVDKFYSDLCKEKNGLLSRINDEMESDKESILIACLPSGQYVGVKLFQSVPVTFKNDETKLNWYRQAASNALTLHSQLEKGHIKAQSVSAQLETDLNLTDEEKSNLDKEREIEEKKLRVQFLKTEMKLIELDAKIKSCLSLEKADTELCLKLIDDLMDLDIKALMLLKHPTCLETVKRMRAYVGNTPSWELSEDDALSFTKQAHAIRKQADRAYKQFKDLFDSPDGLSFWEYFSERVLQFKKCTQKLTADELLEMVHIPKELAAPSAHTMRSAIDAANDKKDATPIKKRNTPAKNKKAPAAVPQTPTKEPPTKETPTKATPKRQGRTKVDKKAEEKAPETSESKTEDSQVASEGEKDDAFNNAVENFEKGPEKETEKKPSKKQEKAAKGKVANKKKDASKEPANKKDSAKKQTTESKDTETNNLETENLENKDVEDANSKSKHMESANSGSKDPDDASENKDTEDKVEETSKNDDVETAKPIEEKMDVDETKTDDAKEVAEQNGPEVAAESTDNDSAVAEKEKDDEPKSKRSRESNKKAEPCTPTKTPTKKKTKS